MNLLKMMGVINITPNSFSGDSASLTPDILNSKLEALRDIPILDFGAESTAPMNVSISYEEELARFAPYLDQIFSWEKVVSIDTYHPETIAFFQQEWVKRSKRNPLVWNDVSGKWDDEVERFLSIPGPYSYVFSHNLAPSRSQSGAHMKFTADHLSREEFFQGLVDYFRPHVRSKVILDPCFGFSKTYEQNWEAIERFGELQKILNHEHWLFGISRKSFLRQKYNLTNSLEDRDLLDQHHKDEIRRLSARWIGEVWIRTHRPLL